MINIFRTFLLSVGVLQSACGGHATNCRYLLLSNKAAMLIDLSLQLLTEALPPKDPQQVGGAIGSNPTPLCGPLLTVLAHMISTLTSGPLREDPTLTTPLLDVIRWALCDIHLYILVCSNQSYACTLYICMTLYMYICIYMYVMLHVITCGWIDYIRMHICVYDWTFVLYLCALWYVYMMLHVITCEWTDCHTRNVCKDWTFILYLLCSEHMYYACMYALRYMWLHVSEQIAIHAHVGVR